MLFYEMKTKKIVTPFENICKKSELSDSNGIFSIYFLIFMNELFFMNEYFYGVF